MNRPKNYRCINTFLRYTFSNRAASRAEAFWLILNPDFIPQFVIDVGHYGHKQHIGVARLARFIAERCGVNGDKHDLLEIAALLHDIGKLQIPDEILESLQKLTPLERAIMKKHSFASY